MRRVSYFIGMAALATLALPLSSYASARSLSIGMSGTDVKALQQTLVDKGYLTAIPNGYFGTQTLAAVKKFQCTQQIVCTGAAYGVVGPKTQAALALGNTSLSTGGEITGKSLTGPYTGPLEFSGWIPDWRLAS